VVSRSTEPRREELTPTVPFHAETVEQMRARLPAALARIWEVWELMKGPADKIVGPGGHAEHVFDWADGIRLIISFDRVVQGSSPRLHVSGSFGEGLAYGLVIETAPESVRLPVFLATIHQRLKALVGAAVDLHLVFLSPAGVPHLLGPTPGELLALREAAGRRAAAPEN
jgi:hypothetical protein